MNRIIQTTTNFITQKKRSLEKYKNLKTFVDDLTFSRCHTNFDEYLDLGLKLENYSPIDARQIIG